MFYSWLSIINPDSKKELFKKLLDPDHRMDSGTLHPDHHGDCHQNLILWSLGHAYGCGMGNFCEKISGYLSILVGNFLKFLKTF